MKVIDIILNEATPTAVKKAKELINRINWFLDLPRSDNVTTLDPKPKNSSNALTPNKLNDRIIDTLKTKRDGIDSALELNDGKLEYLYKSCNDWIKAQELNFTKSNMSYVHPRDDYYAYAEPLIKILASTDNSLISLSPNSGFPISLNYIGKLAKRSFQTYIDKGAALVNNINNNPQTAAISTEELAELNRTHKTYLKSFFAQVKRKMEEKPVPQVRTGLIDYVKQASKDIRNFINSTNLNDRLAADFDYFRSDLNNDDTTWLTDIANQMDTADTLRAGKLKNMFINFLKQRHDIKSQTSVPALNKKGLGKKQQLGELPADFNENNPLHTAWKELIESATMGGNSRQDVSGSYKDFWKTVNNTYRWKCYLTNLDMVATSKSPYKISIDRIDSNKVYEPDNVAFCCFRVNVLKGNLLNNELVAMCKQILKHNGLLVSRINETAKDDPCQDFLNKAGSTKFSMEKLIKRNELVSCIIKNYEDYLHTYEIRELSQIKSVLDKEIENPTSLDYAKFLYKSPEITRIKTIKSDVSKRPSNFRTPAHLLLKGLRDVKRYEEMTFDDFKHDAQRIVKFQPNLKTRVDAAINDAALFYRDIDQMGTLTTNNKYSERLSDTLPRKYRSQRKREREYNKLGRYELPISARRREKEKVEKYKPSISNDELITIANAQRGKCAITGLPMSAIIDSPDMVSIDRTDSKLGGYSAKNIQLVLRRVNSMKGDLPMKDFLYWCSQIYNNRAAEVTYEDLKAAVLHPLANDNDEEVNDETDNSKELD